MKYLWLIVYFLVYVKYYELYRWLLHGGKIKHKYTLMGAGVLAVILFFSPFDALYIAFATYAAAIVFVSISSLWKGSEILSKFLIAIFIQTSLEELITKILTVSLKEKDIETIIKDLIVNAAIVLILLGLSLLHKRRKRKTIGKVISFLENNVLIEMTLALIIFLAVASYVPYASKEQLEVVCLILFGLIGMFGFFAIYTEYKRKENSKLVETEKELIKQQKYYYEKLIEREMGTKRFRHDLKNHLICMKNLTELKQYEALEDYISQISDLGDSATPNMWHTGNEIIDFLTNYYYSLLGPDTKFEVKGKMDEVCDDMKMCVMYSNLIKNAVEEVIGMTEPSEILVNLEMGKVYYKIEVINSINPGKKKYLEEGIHGVGQENIRDILADGETFETKADKGRYTAKIIGKKVKKHV